MEISNKKNYKLEYYYNHREELKEKMRKYNYDNRAVLNDKQKNIMNRIKNKYYIIINYIQKITEIK